MLPAGPARADYNEDLQDYNKLIQGNSEGEKTNPERALAAYRSFLETHQDLHAQLGVQLVDRMADVLYARLKQTEKALQICDWAIDTYKGQRQVVGAITAKARILNGEKRPTEAQTLLEKDWESVMASDMYQVGPAIQQYAAALDAQGKRKEATTAVLKALCSNSDLFHYYYQGTPPAWMYDRVTRDLAARNRIDEALGWAKVCFITAGTSPYDQKAAMELLGRLWRLKDLSDRSIKAFEEALHDPAKPNPLADVKLPEMDVDALTAHAARPVVTVSDVLGIVGALIFTGRMREALVTAREWHDKFPGDARAEICKRVLKAVYLNLNAAEQFDAFRRNGQGPDPLNRLARKLAEEGDRPAGEAPPPAGGVKPAEAARPADAEKPAAPKADAKGETLGYVKDAADDKRNLTGTGYAVAFQCPGKAGCVTSVRLCAARTSPVRGKFHLYLLDGKMQVLADLPFAYSTIGTGELRWYDLAVPSIEVPKQFAVGLDFRPEAKDAIHLGLNRGAKNTHSFVGLPAKGYQKMTQPVEWMVQVVVADQPAGKRE